MAVPACQDRHETPGTHLGRPPPPRIAPVPIATLTNRAVPLPRRPPQTRDEEQSRAGRDQRLGHPPVGGDQGAEVGDLGGVGEDVVDGELTLAPEQSEQLEEILRELIASAEEANEAREQAAAAAA